MTESPPSSDAPGASGSSGSSTDAEADRGHVELPGGGDTLYPDRRFVALYGSPVIATLGALGQQDLDASIDRVQSLADDYQQYSDQPVQPAFEIIASVADSQPGPTGNYSRPADPDQLRPWVEAAGEAGIYVVLDLQPGHADFLSQAEQYEDLLAEPHVGLALDPEWRMRHGSAPGERIGSVDAAEINEVSAWLADLTAEHDLPQKMLILHQFRSSMIENREDVDTSHEQLAITLHADGHGDPRTKQQTWDALRDPRPEDMWMAWKNFYDEDSPTFSPEETFDVDPKPWFVSYQ